MPCGCFACFVFIIKYSEPVETSNGLAALALYVIQGKVFTLFTFLDGAAISTLQESKILLTGGVSTFVIKPLADCHILPAVISFWNRYWLCYYFVHIYVLVLSVV